MKSKILLVTVLLLAISYGFAKDNKNHDSEPLDKIVATVDAQPITQTMLDKRIETIKQALQKNMPQSINDYSLRHLALEQLINTTLQLNMAKKLNLSVEAAEIDQAIADISQHNQMSVTEFKRHLTDNRIDFADYRNEIKQQLLLNKLQRQQVSTNVKYNEQEVQFILDKLHEQMQQQLEYKIQHIFVAVNENADATTEENALALATQIRQEFSAANILPPKHQQQQGFDIVFEDHGWEKSQDIPSVFIKNLALLQAGDTSPVIKTGNGYHLIKLVDKRRPSEQNMKVTEYKISHILLPVDNPQQDQAIEQNALNLVKQLKQGADFAKLAETYSQDAKSASQGGNLGWVDNDSLAPVLINALASLPKDGISQPIRSPQGWHILKKIDSRIVSNADLILKKQARKIAFQRSFNKALSHWVTELRSHAYIQTFPTKQRN